MPTRTGRRRSPVVRWLGAVALVAAGGALAALPAGAATARPAAGQVRPGPRVSERACVSGSGGLSWSGEASGGERVGDQVTITVSLHCASSTPGAPIVGVPLDLTVAPPGLARLTSPATVPTGGTGAAAFHLVARAPGKVTVTVAVADGGTCATAFGSAACRLGFHLSIQPAAGLPPAHPARTLGIVPPHEPARNAPSAPFDVPACRGPAGRYDPSRSCAEVYVGLIDAALAKEHAHPIHLPTNWARLTPPEQLFVTADLERVARGLPPYVGLSARLDALAQAGAVADRDPSAPASGILGAGSNWAGGDVSAAAADYGWVYLDGWGGPGHTDNLDCTSPRSPGCWGHRDNVLGRYTGIECTDCVMGAGVAVTSQESPSLTELFVEPDRPGELPTFFTWAKDVLPYLKG